jgi:hypothetical protein
MEALKRCYVALTDENNKLSMAFITNEWVIIPRGKSSIYLLSVVVAHGE